LDYYKGFTKMQYKQYIAVLLFINVSLEDVHFSAQTNDPKTKFKIT